MSPVDAARALGPTIRERSEEIEQLRRLPDDLVAELSEAGLFQFWIPEVYGGPEVDPVSGLEAVTELARHDTSVAWCAFIATGTSMLAGVLPPEHAEDVYGRPGAITGGFAQPVGRARVVDGGLSISGRWAWGSGTQHCTGIGGGFLVVDDDGNPAPRADGLLVGFGFFDRDDVTFLDTWDVLGVRGSGSTDYEVTDAFVPEGRWANMADLTPKVDSPLMHMPFFPMLSGGLAATAIGLADRALEEFHRLALGKVPQGSGKTLSERPTTQLDHARAEATIASATAFLHDVFGEAWDVVRAGGTADIDLRRRMRLAIADGTQRCVDVVSRLHRVAGGEAVYRRCPLERLFRDANVLSQHAMVAERVLELSGRLSFGLETDTRTL